MASATDRVREQFTGLPQQRLADHVGIWVFLATEVMLFGGIFMTITVNRVIHPDAVQEAARHLYMWIGGINTAVLLSSSLAMAIAVHAAREGARRLTLRALAATIALGTAFLIIKAIEYTLDYRDGLVPHVGPSTPLHHAAAHLHLNMYFIATALHALHVTIGVALIGAITLNVWRRRSPVPRRDIVIEVGGLYWHFVDVVWVFLYPMLYLIGRS